MLKFSRMCFGLAIVVHIVSVISLDGVPGEMGKISVVLLLILSLISATLGLSRGESSKDALYE